MSVSVDDGVGGSGVGVGEWVVVAMVSVVSGSWCVVGVDGKGDGGSRG